MSKIVTVLFGSAASVHIVIGVVDDVACGESRCLRHEVIVGVESRRLWSDDLKASILREVGAGGAITADAVM